MINKKP